jgi:glycine cleavage system H protein
MEPNVNPPNLRYAKTHEWARVEESASGKVATVGVTAFAVEALTDLVFMELPKVGRKVTAGEAFGEIESVKAVSDLYAPVSGEVVEVNSGLPDSLETLNADPFGAGWIAKIRISDERSLDKLMDAAAYEKQCADEAH